MTIRRGDDWGQVGARPAGVRTAASDAALAGALAGAAADGEALAVCVTGGDLLATLGGPSRDGRLRRYPIDLLRVTLDRRGATGVASVVVRRPGRAGWWRGPVLAAMNVGRLGRWDVAPRAHPNDGLLDVVEVEAAFSVRDRWQAWRRLPTGTHVPHPAISVRRARHVEWRLADALDVWIDGRCTGRAHHVTVTVEPDAATVYA